VNSFETKGQTKGLRGGGGWEKKKKVSERVVEGRTFTPGAANPRGGGIGERPEPEEKTQAQEKRIYQRARLLGGKRGKTKRWETSLRKGGGTPCFRNEVFSRSGGCDKKGKSERGRWISKKETERLGERRQKRSLSWKGGKEGRFGKT